VPASVLAAVVFYLSLKIFLKKSLSKEFQEMLLVDKLQVIKWIRVIVSSLNRLWEDPSINMMFIQQKFSCQMYNQINNYIIKVIPKRSHASQH
jgi:hypothetical protein